MGHMEYTVGDHDAEVVVCQLISVSDTSDDDGSPTMAVVQYPDGQGGVGIMTEMDLPGAVAFLQMVARHVARLQERVNAEV